MELESLLTVSGAVIFIELVMQLLWKPFVKNVNLGGFADLANNLVAFVLGLIGVLGAAYFTGGITANLFLTALVAASIATGAYEVVKNVGVGARS